MEHDFQALYREETARGERYAYVFRWIIVAILAAGVGIMLATGRYIEGAVWSTWMVGTAALYNLALTFLLRAQTLSLPWVKWASVTLDLTLVAGSQYVISRFSSPLAVSTFATILVYPILILYASFRHNRSLIVFATLYTAVIFNLVYYMSYPDIDPELVQQVASADPVGHSYKTIYILAFGFSLLLIPRIIRRLVKKESEIEGEKLRLELETKMERQRREFLFDNLCKYVSREIAELLVDKPELLAGRTVRLTAMFVDIRGFTAYCESKEPAQVLAFLNAFYELVAEVVIEAGGIVNKYIGDAVFALFGALDGRNESELAALRTAETLLSRYAASSERFMREFGAHPDIGIGMDSGEAIVGNVGGKERVEFTALGTVVNTASRLEAMNKRLGTRVILTEAVERSVADATKGSRLQDLGKHAIRGLQGEHRLFTIHLP
jgi:class 3 adenylate cyclase